MHSLQLVDLTEMTEEVLDEGQQQPNQLVQYNEPEDVAFGDEAQLRLQQEQ